MAATRLAIYQVDAFADRVFEGNPAAVCPLESWLPADVMQAVAAENNLAETAFFVPRGDGWHLRWFTPTVEIELCGHATLASGFVISTILDPGHRFWHIAAESGASPGEARFACQGTDAGQVAVVAHDGKEVSCVVELGADRARENGSILSPRLQKLFLEGLVPAGRFSVSGIECRVHRRQAQA